MVDYYQKYIKYKMKYIDLLNKLNGGGLQCGVTRNCDECKKYNCTKCAKGYKLNNNSGSVTCEKKLETGPNANAINAAKNSNNPNFGLKITKAEIHHRE